MSVKEINDFIKKSAQKRKLDQEKRNIEVKNYIIEKAIAKKRSIDETLKTGYNPRVFLVLKLTAVIALLITSFFAILKYYEFYIYQTRNIQSYHLNKPDKNGQIIRDFETCIRTDSKPLLMNDIDPSTKEILSLTIQKLSKSQFAISDLDQIKDPQNDRAETYRLQCLTNTEKIEFKFSLCDGNYKIIDIDSYPHKIPIDL